MVNNWLVNDSGLATSDVHDKKNETEKMEQKQNVSIFGQDYSELSSQTAKELERM